MFLCKFRQFLNMKVSITPSMSNLKVKVDIDTTNTKEVKNKKIY